MLTDFQISFTGRRSSKFVVRKENIPWFHHIPQTRRYTTLWSVYAHTPLWFGTEWIKLPWKTQPFDSYWKNIRSLTKRCSQRRQQKPANETDRMLWGNQARRRRDKTPTHTINVQSLVASVDESQLVDSTPVWYLPILVSWSPRAIKVHTLRFSADLVRT